MCIVNPCDGRVAVGCQNIEEGINRVNYKFNKYTALLMVFRYSNYTEYILW